MSRMLLHVDSSIHGEASVTRRLTAAIVERLTDDDPQFQVAYRDLAADPLDHVSPAHLRDDEGGVLAQFLSADVIVIGAPMYNFSIPSQLKTWIDRIVIPRRTFRYTPDGHPEPVVRASQKLIVASARGGAYGEAEAALIDHQESYLRSVFAFIGVHDVSVVRAEGVARDREGAIAKAMAQVRDLQSGARAGAHCPVPGLVPSNQP